MCRIQQTLDAVRNGDPSARVRLRDGDFLMSTSEHINELLEWVEQNVPSGGPQGATAAEDGAANLQETAPAEAR